MSQPFTKVVSKKNKRHIDITTNIDAEKKIDKAVYLKLEEDVFNFLKTCVGNTAKLSHLGGSIFSGTSNKAKLYCKYVKEVGGMKSFLLESRKFVIYKHKSSKVTDLICTSRLSKPHLLLRDWPQNYEVVKNHYSKKPCPSSVCNTKGVNVSSKTFSTRKATVETGTKNILGDSDTTNAEEKRVATTASRSTQTSSAITSMKNLRYGKEHWIEYGSQISISYVTALREKLMQNIGAHGMSEILLDFVLKYKEEALHLISNYMNQVETKTSMKQDEPSIVS